MSDDAHASSIIASASGITRKVTGGSGSTGAFSFVSPLRTKDFLFSPCGHTCARLLCGDRVELVDVTTGRDINRSLRISAEHILSAGDKLVMLNWDDVDVDLFSHGGKNRVRADVEKSMIELLGLYPLSPNRPPRTGRFDGTLRCVDSFRQPPPPLVCWPY